MDHDPEVHHHPMYKKHMKERKRIVTNMSSMTLPVVAIGRTVGKIDPPFVQRLACNLFVLRGDGGGGGVGLMFCCWTVLDFVTILMMSLYTSIPVYFIQCDNPIVFALMERISTAKGDDRRGLIFINDRDVIRDVTFFQYRRLCQLTTRAEVK